MENLKISPIFQNLIPPLTDDELRQLEENLLAQGCGDAIKTWRGVIIDGHNRYSLCQKHNIPFDTSEMRFQSKKDAELWIIENQLGRRNLTQVTRIKLAARKIELLENKPANTRKAIADEAKVSEGNVRKYMKIRELANSKLLAEVETGDKKIGTAYKALSVTVKTYEKLVTTDEDYTISDSPLSDGVFHYIDGIGMHYGVLLERVGVIDEEDVDGVLRLLTRQGEGNLAMCNYNNVSSQIA